MSVETINELGFVEMLYCEERAVWVAEGEVDELTDGYEVLQICSFRLGGT